MTTERTDGTASYQGYEYQIRATVWVSLDLMFARRVCRSIVVEPASGEDVEANLVVPPEKALSSVTLDIDLQATEIQIKLRRTNQWTAAPFLDVLRRPLPRLQADPSSRFVLLTDAQVSRDLLPFLIEHVGEDSQAVTIPGGDLPVDSSQTARRLGILQQQHPEVIRARTDALLQQAGVPYSERPACAKRLQEVIRSRLLREARPEFTHEELFALLRAFDGLPSQVPGEFFVAPQNLEAMAQQLEELHRLSIVGPPGTGKTLAARELARQHRIAPDPFKVVRCQSPGEIAKHLEESGRHLFFVEDPWGQFKLSTDADRWTTELPKLLSRANDDKRFLIVSRAAIQSIAYASRLPNDIVAIQYRLDESHYTVEQRWDILVRSLKDADSWQCDFIQEHRDQILNKLTAPYSLTLLASKLRRAKSEDRTLLPTLLRDSNVDAISSAVANEIQSLGREWIASTIALWAWAMAQRKITHGAADQLRRMIRAGGFAGDIDVSKLLAFLAHAQWFGENEGEFSAHPAILEGLELVMIREPGLAGEVLRALMEGLATASRGDIAYRVRKALAGRQLPVPPSAQHAMNAHLLSRLEATSRPDFLGAFREAARDCSSFEPLAVLVRALRATPIRGGIREYEPWQAPVLAEHEIEQIRASSAARDVAAKFIRFMLSSEYAQPYEESQLQTFLGQFGWNFDEVYLSAVQEGLEQDNFDVGAAVQGALNVADPPFDLVIDAALCHYDGTIRWLEERQDLFREARQAEMDADYASHLEEEPQERFAPSQAVIRAAVALRNQRQGHEWIVNHPRCEDLLDAWAQSLTPTTSLSEFEALAKACRPSQTRVFFKAAEKSGNVQLVALIVESMLLADEDLADGWRALVHLQTGEELAQTTTAAFAGLSFIRRLELADSIATSHLRDITDGEERASHAIDALFRGHECIVWEALDRSRIGRTPFPAHDADLVLASLRATAGECTSCDLAVRASFQLANWGADVSVYLPRLLASHAPDVRQNALRLSGLYDGAEVRALLIAALGDEDYRCRREAMNQLAGGATEAEKRSILALARDPSAPVRQRCAEIIGEREWVDADSVLLELLRDRRSNQSGAGLIRGHFPCFHVARAAAQALGKLGDKARLSTFESVKTFLLARRPDQDDHVVHYYALQFLAGVQGPDVIAMLLKHLSDEWHVGGFKDKGFPLRYVAAWGLLAHLHHDNSIADQISIATLYDAARHHDARLAGPALVCLGLCGHRAVGEIVHFCRLELSTNRAALLRIAMALADAPPPPELSRILQQHPVGPLVAAAHLGQVSDEVQWERFRKANPEVQEWLADIQSSEDVNAVLRLALHLLFSEQIQVLLSHDDIREKELPEMIPVINLRTLTGGE